MIWRLLVAVPVAGIVGCNPDLRCPYGACSIDSGGEVEDTGEDAVIKQAELVTGERVTCQAPSERQSAAFDVKRALPIESKSIGILGGGVLSADFDQDGIRDVLVLGADSPQLWSQDSEGGFTNTTNVTLPNWGVGMSNLTGGSLVDIDADGDLDVYVTVWNADNMLWINEGGVFSEAEDWSGYGGGVHRNMSSAWADMDADGDLDLVLGGFGPQPEDANASEADFEVGDPILLLENIGDGSFVDVSERLPQALNDGYQSSVAWIDLDGDARQDLVVSNNYGWVRAGDVVWNTESGFELDSGMSGFGDERAVFGLGIGDFNGDGSPDFVRSGFKEISLLTSTGGGWNESSGALGVVPNDAQDFGWGVVVEDFDNDRDLDAMMTFGYWDQFNNPEEQPDALFIQNDSSVFADRAGLWGVDGEGYGRGLVATDPNGDGWMDVVKQQLDDSSVMHISRCGEETWLVVSLEDEGLNRFGIGAAVQITMDGATQTRWLTAGGFSAFSASTPEVHFGLGAATSVDTLTITWPDGQVDTFEGVEARQHAVVRRSVSAQ